MASLVKIWTVRYVSEDGKRVSKDTPGSKRVRERSRVWYGQFKGPDGKWKRTPLFSDKAASQAELGKLVRKLERGEAGLTDPFEESLNRDIAQHVRDYLANAMCNLSGLEKV
jgi:hypothetical protein